MRPGARLGRSAETLVLIWLLLTGHRLRHRNWRGAGGELDLVVERGDLVLFVEVKARSSDDFGGGAGAVGPAKRDVLSRVVAAYLSRHNLWHRPARVDVVVLERRPRFPWLTVRRYYDAVGRTQDGVV